MQEEKSMGIKNTALQYLTNFLKMSDDPSFGFKGQHLKTNFANLGDCNKNETKSSNLSSEVVVYKFEEEKSSSEKFIVCLQFSTSAYQTTIKVCVNR